MRSIIQALLFAVLLVAPQLLVRAQTSLSQNEGLTLEKTEESDAFGLSWWGRSGNTYFVQYTEDLISAWTYFPIIETGGNNVIRYEFTNNSQRFFFRLRFTDRPTSNPIIDDFDSDGVSNWDEVQQGADPFTSGGARIVIHWPPEQASIPARTVDVLGSWQGASQLRSLKLNGHPVYINGASWSALAIPLTLGSNELIVVATDINGITTKISRKLSASFTAGQPNPVTLSSSITTGNPPLTPTFTAAVNVSGTIESIKYFFISRAQSEIQVSTLSPQVFTYSEIGTFYPAVTVKFTDGSSYSSSGPATPLAERLQIKVGDFGDPLAVWSAFRSALTAQDVESALSHMSPHRTDSYRELFYDMGPGGLATVASDLQSLAEAINYGEVAQYFARVVTDKGEVSFPVNFYKENNVWLIDEF